MVSRSGSRKLRRSRRRRCIDQCIGQCQKWFANVRSCNFNLEDAPRPERSLEGLGTFGLLFVPVSAEFFEKPLEPVFCQQGSKILGAWNQSLVRKMAKGIRSIKYKKSYLYCTKKTNLLSERPNRYFVLFIVGVGISGSA